MSLHGMARGSGPRDHSNLEGGPPHPVPSRGTTTMASEGSITHCITLLKAGERAAAQQLWERYFQRLVGLARTKLRGTARRAAEEEDVALSAFDSFYQRAERGQFPQLNDRDDLWQLLVVITVRKAIDLVHHEG